MTFEHVGSRSLLLQRFPELVEQARVLDCNRRLVGKGRHQLNLFVCEWSHGTTRHLEYADCNTLTQQGDAQHRANAATLNRLSPRVFWIGRDIGNVDNSAFERRPSNECAAARLDQEPFQVLLVLSGKSKISCKPVTDALAAKNERLVGVA